MPEFDMSSAVFDEEQATPANDITAEGGVFDLEGVKFDDGSTSVDQGSVLSPFTDLFKGIYAGITRRMPEQIGQAMQFSGVAPETGKAITEWAREGEDRTEEKGMFRQAGEMIPPSTGLSGALNIGGQLISKIPHPYARIAGLGMQGLSYVAAPLLFGLSQAQETKEGSEARIKELEEAISKGGETPELQDELERVKENAKWAPYVTGGIEALGETVGNWALLRLLGPLAKTGTKAAGKTIKETLKPTLGRYAKEVAFKTLPTEILTEMGQNYGESLTEKGTGIRPEANPWKEAVDAIGPTAIMTLLTGGGGRVLQSHVANNYLKALGTPDNDPADRAAVAQSIGHLIREEYQDPETADVWENYAAKKIGAREPIDPDMVLDKDVLSPSVEKVFDDAMRSSTDIDSAAEKLVNDLSNIDPMLAITRGRPPIAQKPSGISPIEQGPSWMGKLTEGQTALPPNGQRALSPGSPFGMPPSPLDRFTKPQQEPQGPNGPVAMGPSDVAPRGPEDLGQTYTAQETGRPFDIMQSLYESLARNDDRNEGMSPLMIEGYLERGGVIPDNRKDLAAQYPDAMYEGERRLFHANTTGIEGDLSDEYIMPGSHGEGHYLSDDLGYVEEYGELKSKGGSNKGYRVLEALFKGKNLFDLDAPLSPANRRKIENALKERGTSLRQITEEAEKNVPAEILKDQTDESRELGINVLYALENSLGTKETSNFLHGLGFAGNVYKNERGSNNFAIYTAEDLEKMTIIIDRMIEDVKLEGQEEAAYAISLDRERSEGAQDNAEGEKPSGEDGRAAEDQGTARGAEGEEGKRGTGQRTADTESPEVKPAGKKKASTKPQKPETLESYVRKHRINFNILGHSNKEAIKDGLFGFVKNDAAPLDKAAEELQGLGLLGATPEEYASPGDYLYAELQKIVYNRAKNKLETLTDEEEEVIRQVRKELKDAGYSDDEIESDLSEAERAVATEVSAEKASEENRIASELLDEDFVAEEEPTEVNPSEETIRKLSFPDTIFRAGEVKSNDQWEFGVPGVFFGGSKEVAKIYGDNIEAYQVNSSLNPLIIAVNEEKPLASETIAVSDLANVTLPDGTTMSMQDVGKYAKENGYDSILEIGNESAMSGSIDDANIFILDEALDKVRKKEKAPSSSELFDTSSMFTLSGNQPFEQKKMKVNERKGERLLDVDKQDVDELKDRLSGEKAKREHEEGKTHTYNVFRGVDYEETEPRAYNGTYGEGIYYTHSEASAKVYGKNISEHTVTLKNPYIIKGTHEKGVPLEKMAEHVESEIKPKGYDGLVLLDKDGNVFELVKFPEKGQEERPWFYTKPVSEMSEDELKDAMKRLANNEEAKDRYEEVAGALHERMTGEVVPESGKIEDFGEKIGGARKDTAERGFTMTKREGKEETTPAWKKRFVAMELIKRPGTWMVFDSKTNRTNGQHFQSQGEAEEAIPLFAVAQQHQVLERDGEHSIYKRVGERKRLKVVNRSFPSREEAMKYMVLHAEELLNLKASFGEEILPVPEKAYRKGQERRTGNATPEMFMETFAPRGIEFGNWNNQEERQQVMNHAYDGLLDLADALDIDPKALMLNGELAIAFGARGQGLSGAKAHYEPGYGVINLTKMKGAGSLAHEWFHSFDHYLARLDTKAATERKENKKGDLIYPVRGDKYDFQSHGPSYKTQLRPKVAETYKNLIESLYKKAQQYVENTEQAENFLGKARDNLRYYLDEVRRYIASDYSEYHKNKFGKPASEENLAEFDRLADILVQGGDLDTEFRKIETKQVRSKYSSGGRYTNDTLEAINGLMKAVRNRQGFNSEQSGMLDRVKAAMGLYSARIKMLDDAEKGTEKTRKAPTSYAIEAKKMDQARVGDYWSTPHEMAARAFAAYVEDKIAEKGGQSDFLVYQARGGVLLPMIDGFIAQPYPEGKEREAINKAFDEFVKTLETKETDKGVMLFSLGPSEKDGNIESPIRPRHTVDKVQGFLEPLLKKLRNTGKIKVVQSAKDIPGVDTSKLSEKDVVYGAHDFDTDTTYIVADSVKDIRNAHAILIHEVVGHRGVEAVLNDDEIYDVFQAAVDAYKGTDLLKKVVKDYHLDLDDRVHRYMAGRELIAHMAETGEKPTVMQRIIGIIRDALRRLNFRLKWTDTDIKNLIRKGWEYTERDGKGLKKRDGDISFKQTTAETEPSLDDTAAAFKAKFNDEARAALFSIGEKVKHPIWREIFGSPEWINHPVVRNIVDIFTNKRSERYHHYFNDLIDADNKEEGNIVDELDKLRKKGMSLTDIVAGKTSKEYQLLEKAIDNGDVYHITPKKMEEWFKKTNTPDEVVSAWRRLRESWDSALDLMQGQIKELIAENEGKQGKIPGYESTLDQLKEALAMMNEWRGSYAPRIRPAGSYVIQATKGEGKEKEYFRTHGSAREMKALEMQMQREGWNTKVDKLTRLPEATYQNIKTVEVANLLENVLKNVKDPTVAAQMNDELIQMVADTIRARGYRQTMIHRGKTLVTGYITDPMERFMRYTTSLSGGLSKSEIAREAMDEFRKIDPAKEPDYHRQMQSYIRENLRNIEAVDRAFGLAKSIATFKFLGFNLRSLGVNLTAIATTAPAAIHQYAVDGKAGFAKIAQNLSVAGRDYVKFMFGKQAGNEEEQAFLENMRKEGYDDPQYTRDAMAKMQKLHGQLWNRIMGASMYLFGKSEQWNRGTTMLAAYRLARKQGYSVEEASQRAHEASNRAHGVYGKGTLPSWATGDNIGSKLGQAMYTYGKFGHNYVQMLTDLLKTDNMAGSGKRNIKAFTWAIMSPVVLAGATVFPFKENVMAIFSGMLKALGVADDPEKWWWDMVREYLGDTAETAGRHGLTGLAGIDISGSLSVGVGIPKSLIELLGPIGGLIEEGMKASGYMATGQPGRAFEKLLPTGLANPLRAVREASTGIVTEKGNRIWDEEGKPLTPSAGETAARAVGFRGSRQAVLSEREREAKKVEARYSDRRSRIYEEFRAYFAEENPSKEWQTKIWDKVHKYNEEVIDKDLRPEIPIITHASIRRQALEMIKPSKKEMARKGL